VSEGNKTPTEFPIPSGYCVCAIQDIKPSVLAQSVPEELLYALFNILLFGLLRSFGHTSVLLKYSRKKLVLSGTMNGEVSTAYITKISFH
jgi:hypothetical protein